MQKTLTFFIAAVILYTIVKTQIYPAMPEPNENKQSAENSATTDVVKTLEPSTPLTGNFIEKTVSKVIINALKTEEGRNFFENLIQPMNKPLSSPNYTIEMHKDLVGPLFKISTFGSGNIGPASCGHVVTIRYQLADSDNILIKEETKTLTLGARSIMPGMDSVIIGMMAGETRQAIIPAKYAYYNDKHPGGSTSSMSYRLNVTLHSILPQNFIKNHDIKVFDDEIAYRSPLLCGDKVSFNAKITRLSNGEILYDSNGANKIVEINIGDINYPLIISHVLHGKVPVGTRTVIAKRSSFKAIGSNSNKMLSLQNIPANEYLMLELSNFKTNN